MSKYIGDVSAYAYAVSKGYAGTEEEFAELMADYAEVGQRAEDAADRAEAALDEFTSVTADATTLPEGSSATAEYSDGHLSLGIPKGDTGDGAYHVEPSGESFIIHTDADGVATAQEFRIYLDARQGTVKKNVTSVTGLPSISLVGGGTIAPEVFKNAFSGNISVIIYTIPAGAQIATEQIDTQYIARVDNGTANGFNMQCALSVAVVKDGAKGDKGDTGPQGEQGIQGPIGETPNLTIGTVTTLQPTAPATATISGTADNPVLSFGIPKGDTGEVSQDQFDAALALKADAIGNYPDLAVGTAEQIDSDTVVSEDVAPYQFRQSISGASNRAYDEIVGGSLAVNQLVNPDFSSPKVVNGVTYTKNVDGSISVSGESTGRSNIPVNTEEYINIVQSHKYLIAGNPSGASQSTYYMALVGYTNASYAFAQYAYTDTIINNTHSTANHARLEICGASASGVSVNVVFYPQLFDLTQMFGTTIADYVYSLETATAGAGVEWLKAHFPRIFNAGYIPYNAGELVSVQASAHKMTGFNQWDEEWELGYYNITTGEPVSSAINIRSKNYIRVVPNAAYYANIPTGAITITEYDVEKTFIKSTQGIARSAFNISATTAYIRLHVTSAYGATYNHDICINLSDPAKNGTYEPYEGHSYPLDDSLELRGLPKLDADNNLVYDGDVYESTGKVARKYGIVDLGTVNWSTSSTNVFTTNGLVGTIKEPSSYSETPDIITPKYLAASYLYLWSDEKDKTVTVIWSSSSSHGGIWVRDSSYTDAATFKAAMSGVYLVYEKATPTTESVQPFTNPQVVDASGTEEYVTDSVVPVGHVTKYVENLKAKLESAPASPTEDGDYIVRQTDGVNEYVPLDSAPTITAKADVTDLLKAFPTDSAQGAIASFSDGAELPIKSLTVDIEPIQDLHGYDNPWPAGGGKNLFDADMWITLGRNNVYYSVTDEDISVIADDVGGLSDRLIQLAPNTQYTISFKNATSGRVFANTTTTLAQFSNSETSATFTTTESGQIAIKFYSTTYPHVVGKVQIELGSTATAYAPYENICPISGHTQAVVTRTGVNVWDEEWEVGGISADNGENVTATDRIRSKNYISVVPGVSYYFKSSNTIGLRLYDGDKHYVTSTVQTNLAYTIPANIRYVRFIVLNTTTYNHDISINYPATDTDYHEGHVQSITIALGQTVYGGKIDVLSGELVIDRAMVDLGTLSWNYTAATQERPVNNFFSDANASIPSSVSTNVVCTIYKASNKPVSNRDEENTVCTFNQRVYVSTNSYTDAATFKTAMSGVQLCYELATPITITLTPNELSTLLGANNIWSDAGEVTAEYRADPTLFIQRKIAEALS